MQIGLLQDIDLSSAGLVAFSHVYLAIAIMIDNPGPILFIQKKVGKDKEYFNLHKFRLMKMPIPYDVPTYMFRRFRTIHNQSWKIIAAYSLDGKVIIRQTLKNFGFARDLCFCPTGIYP